MTDGERPRYWVHTFRDIDAVGPVLQGLADHHFTELIFQDLRWLRPWFASFVLTGVTPLIVVITEGAKPPRVDNVAMVLPLVRRTRYLLPVVEFADCGVTDYNLPLAGPRAPRTVRDMQSLVTALHRALRPFAFLRLADMPRELNGQLNPFAHLEASNASRLTAHNLPLPAQSTGFLRSFGKKKRTEIERVGRALDALGENRFAISASQHERQQVLALIQQSQRARVPRKGYRYVLEEPGYREFYERLVFDPATANVTVVSAIWLTDRPVAGLLGVHHRDRFIALRIGISTEPEILRLGLGKVLLMRTAEWAIDQGLRVFDFSIGTNALKAWFHPEPLELIEFKSLFNGFLPGRAAHRPHGLRQINSRRIHVHSA